MLHGSLDMNGAVLDFVHNQDRSGMEWIIRIIPATAYTSFECGVQSKELVGEPFIAYASFI